MDTDKIKLPLSWTIGIMVAMATSIGGFSVAMYQLQEVRSTLSEVTNRAEVSAQAVMQADVTRLKSDVGKLLVLSDDNMNKIIAINAKGEPEEYDDRALRSAIDAVQLELRGLGNYDDTGLKLAIQDLRRSVDDLKREEGRIKNNQQQLIADVDDLFTDLDELLERD